MKQSQLLFLAKAGGQAIGQSSKFDFRMINLDTVSVNLVNGLKFGRYCSLLMILDLNKPWMDYSLKERKNLIEIRVTRSKVKVIVAII